MEVKQALEILETVLNVAVKQGCFETAISVNRAVVAFETIVKKCMPQNPDQSNEG